MLVIISDIHLTDGSSGQTIEAGAFRTFVEDLQTSVRDACWRADGRFVPLERCDLLMLGDVLDVIRSDRWLASPEGLRPWSGNEQIGPIVRAITSGILKHNERALAHLRELGGFEPIRLSRPMPRATSFTSAPTFSARSAISLIKVTLVARKAFAAYLIISALRGVVCRIGQLNFAYISANTELARAVLAPMTMRSGLVKSSTARPSLRNSGFIARPKSRPLTMPDAASSSPRTTVSVVVGTTVLLTTTTW